MIPVSRNVWVPKESCVSQSRESQSLLCTVHISKSQIPCTYNCYFTSLIIDGGLVCNNRQLELEKHTFLIHVFNESILKMSMLNTIFGMNFDTGYSLVPFS